MENDNNPILAEVNRLALVGWFSVKVGRPQQLEPSLYQFAFHLTDSRVELFQVRGNLAQVGQWWAEVFKLQVERSQFASDMARIMQNDE